LSIKFVQTCAVARTLHSAVLQRLVEVFSQVVLQKTKQQKLRLRAVSGKEASATLSIHILLFKPLGKKKILNSMKSQETRCVVFWYLQ